MKKLFIVILLISLALCIFAQEAYQTDNPQNAEPRTVVIDAGQQPTELPNLVTNAVESIMSLLTFLILYLLGKWIKGLSDSQVTTEIINARHMSALTQRQKRDVVVETIKKKPLISLVTNIIHGSLPAAVDWIYQTVYKKNKIGRL